MIDYNPAKAFVEKNDDLQILDEELSSEEYAMCVNKDNSELTAKINEALTQLKEDGTLDAIVSNYIGDEAGQHPYTSPEGVDRSNGTLVMATNATFEPYEYYDRNAILTVNATNFTKLINGKLDPVIAFTTGKLKVDGDIKCRFRAYQVY